MDAPLEVTVIPAQRRGQRTWSPDDLVDPEGDGDDTRNEDGDTWTDERDAIPSSHPPNDRPDLPVTVIPAPSRNRHRTWSPQDMDQPSHHASSRSAPAAPPPSDERHGLPGDLTDQEKASSQGDETAQNVSSQTERGPPNGPGSGGPVLSRRGTLIISENESRNLSGSYRRSLYSRTSPQPVRPDPAMTVARPEASIAEAQRGRGSAPSPDVAGENEAE